MNHFDAVRSNFGDLYTSHIEEAAIRLTRQVRNTVPALDEICSFETSHANFLAMAYASHPRCEVLPSDREHVFLFRVISPPEASCLGAILGNDTNISLHVGENGTTQSNAIIGICTDAVMRALGGKLLEVNPLTFRNAIPLGESVIVTIELLQRKQLTTATILVTREQDDKVVLKQAGLKMTPNNHPTSVG